MPPAPTFTRCGLWLRLSLGSATARCWLVVVLAIDRDKVNQLGSHLTTGPHPTPPPLLVASQATQAGTRGRLRSPGPMNATLWAAMCWGWTLAKDLPYNSYSLLCNYPKAFSTIALVSRGPGVNTGGREGGMDTSTAKGQGTSPALTCSLCVFNISSTLFYLGVHHRRRGTGPAPAREAGTPPSPLIRPFASQPPPATPFHVQLRSLRVRRDWQSGLR